jgi:predicted phosphodiesterase
MRIALISDLHANEVALDAVLEDIAQVGVDQIVCLGDTATLGPRPHAILERLRDLGCPCIMGNHDAFMLDAGLIHTYTEAPVVVEAVDWCRDQLSADELDFIRTFQPSIEIPLDAGCTALLYHGSPRSHMEEILATTAADELEQIFAGHTATVMGGGHTHVQMLRQHHGTLIVNPGSLGQPFRHYVVGQAPTLMSHAEYATIEARSGAINVTLRRVPLDLNALRQSVAAVDNPLRDFLLEQYA